jgi:hypothetical protein
VSMVCFFGAADSQTLCLAAEIQSLIIIRVQACCAGRVVVRGGVHLLLMPVEFI